MRTPLDLLSLHINVRLRHIRLQLVKGDGLVLVSIGLSKGRVPLGVGAQQVEQAPVLAATVCGITVRLQG